jgi:hypothetical protein
MKTFPRLVWIIVAVLSLAGFGSVATAEPEPLTANEIAVYESWDRVFSKWPEAEDPDSELGKEIKRLIDLRAADGETPDGKWVNPILNSTNYPWIVTGEAVRNLKEESAKSDYAIGPEAGRNIFVAVIVIGIGVTVFLVKKFSLRSVIGVCAIAVAALWIMVPKWVIELQDRTTGRVGAVRDGGRAFVGTPPYSGLDGHRPKIDWPATAIPALGFGIVGWLALRRKDSDPTAKRGTPV